MTEGRRYVITDEMLIEEQQRIEAGEPHPAMVKLGQQAYKAMMEHIQLGQVKQCHCKELEQRLDEARAEINELLNAISRYSNDIQELKDALSETIDEAKFWRGEYFKIDSDLRELRKEASDVQRLP